LYSLISQGAENGNRDLISACNQLAAVLQSIAGQAEKPPANLENRTDCATEPCYMTGENIMSREHRLRMQLGVNDDGTPIVRQIRGKSELELAENIIKAAIETGRIWDFMPRPVMAEPREKTLFSEYADRWRTTYKSGVAGN